MVDCKYTGVYEDCEETMEDEVAVPMAWPPLGLPENTGFVCPTCYTNNRQLEDTDFGEWITEE